MSRFMTHAFARTAFARTAFALALAFAALGTPQARAVPIERIVSPGGIEAWIVRDATVPLVAMEFAFRGGASQDPADKSGVAHMVAHMLDEGAGDLDDKAFSARMESRAIQINFAASRDYFRGTLRTLKDNRGEAFDLLRLALASARFDAAPIERVRAQMLSGLRSETTNPNQIASQRWWATAFPAHPYGRKVNGTLESVPRIGADDMRAYVGRVFARDNLKVAIVGDIEAADAAAMLDRVFGGLPAKAQLQPVAAARPQGIGRRIVVDLDVPQAVVIFGGQGIARSDPDFIAAYIVNYILGGGSFNSRLYREVREKRGLAYSVSDSLVWLRHAALFVGSTAVRSDRAAEALTVIEEEIRRLAAEGPTDDELAKAKSYLKGSYALGLDTSTKIASALTQIQLDDLGIDYINRRDALLDAVTLADARRVAKRLLDGGLLVTVVGRPQGLTSAGGG